MQSFGLIRKIRELFSKERPKSFDSRAYWTRRYEAGLTSGEGSYGELATFKAEVLNHFVSTRKVQSVIEFGCGDGNQLKYASYPKYVGYDVSDEAVKKCRQLFLKDESKSFDLIDRYSGGKAQLALSLDVLYHLVEEPVYEEYLRRLFAASERYVVIYSADMDNPPGSRADHEYYRKFTAWISRHQASWKLIEHIPNRYASSSSADFYIYERT